MNDGREFQINYRNIYPKKLNLAKENIEKHEVSFWVLDTKIWNRKFHVSPINNKRYLLPFWSAWASCRIKPICQSLNLV